MDVTGVPYITGAQLFAIMSRLARNGQTMTIAYDGDAIIDGRDVDTGAEYRVANVSLTGLAEWVSGEAIHVCLSYLSTDEREFLISGMTPDAFVG